MIFRTRFLFFEVVRFKRRGNGYGSGVGSVDGGVPLGVNEEFILLLR